MRSKQKSKRESTSRPSLAWFLKAGILTTIGTQPASALQEALGHVELGPVYTVGTKAWAWNTHWFDDDLNDRTDAVGVLYFPGYDVAPGNYGVRNLRPADVKWNFLGVGAGEPLWIFSDTSQTSIGFGATDTLLTGDLVYRLDGVTGPAGGHFSMYSGSAPMIQMQTMGGISAADEFRKPLNHSHVNWAFSKKGLWIVRMKVQGTVKSTGVATAQSPVQPLVFAIGSYARWKAATFTQAELANPAVSGDAADPDGDGLNNLTEYALGGNPRVASPLRVADQQPLAPRLLPPATTGAPWSFTFHRRTATDEPDLRYVVESSPTLAGGSWTEEDGAEDIVSDGEVWQQVAIPLAQAPVTGGEKRFFRLRVETE